jgi:hypothetical protein
VDIVFALMDGISYSQDSAVVTTARGQVWYADDPFVKQRPDIFSATPPVIHNTTGAQQLDAPSLEESPAHSTEESASRGRKSTRR